jgi:hypothetical protein
MLGSVWCRRPIRADYRQVGEQVWGRFQGGREGTLWYYDELVKAFRAAPPDPRVDPLVNELDHAPCIARRAPLRRRESAS